MTVQPTAIDAAALEKASEALIDFFLMGIRVSNIDKRNYRKGVEVAIRAYLAALYAEPPEAAVRIRQLEAERDEAMLIAKEEASLLVRLLRRHVPKDHQDYVQVSDYIKRKKLLSALRGARAFLDTEGAGK